MTTKTKFNESFYVGIAITILAILLGIATSGCGDNLTPQEEEELGVIVPGVPAPAPVAAHVAPSEHVLFTFDAFTLRAGEAGVVARITLPPEAQVGFVVISSSGGHAWATLKYEGPPADPQQVSPHKHYIWQDISSQGAQTFEPLPVPLGGDYAFTLGCSPESLEPCTLGLRVYGIW